MVDCLIVAAGGKTGHERQAEAVANRLAITFSTHRVDATSPPPDVGPETALVLAAGRQAIAPARRIARAPAPRPVVAVLQPVLWRPADFDLIWAPLHDRSVLDRSRNRIETLTAPSAVSAAQRAAGAALIDARIAPRPCVGVLVGGASRAHRFGVAEARELAARLVAFATAHDVALLVSTSRRTGREQAGILADRLRGTPHILVDGTAADASLAYAGIIERAGAFVVTSDSVAMLSDAAATGKPIYGWRLPGGKAKFETFYLALEAHGALRWFDGDLQHWAYPALDAANVIAEALRPRLGLSNAALQHK